MVATCHGAGVSLDDLPQAPIDQKARVAATPSATDAASFDERT